MAGIVGRGFAYRAGRLRCSLDGCSGNCRAGFISHRSLKSSRGLPERRLPTKERCQAYHHRKKDSLAHFSSPLVTTPIIAIPAFKACQTPKLLLFAQRQNPISPNPRATHKKAALQMHNPMLPRPVQVLIWVKKPVRRNYFPFAVVSRPSDFFSTFITINLLVSIN